MKFPERLAQLRKEYKITQKELAMKLGVSRGTIGMYEIGQRDPDSETINKIADFFNVSTDYLLGRSNIRNPYDRTSDTSKNKSTDYNQPIEKTNHIKNEQNNNSLKLTRRDEREIEKILEKTRKQLENAEGLMFDGKPASPEAIQSILDSMRIGMEIAKQRNKEKYTPKKYRNEQNNNEKEEH